MKYRIFHVDAFNWLKTCKRASIHAVVTDPPFGIVEYRPHQLEKRNNGNGGIWRLPNSFDGRKRSPTPRFTVLNQKDHQDIIEFHRRLASELIQVLVPGGHVILASQNLLSHYVITSFLESGFELRGQIVRVVKTLRGGDRPKGAHNEYPDLSVTPRSSWEPWLIFRKPCEGRIKDNLEKWYTSALRRPTAEKPFRDLIEASPARGEERKISPHPSLKPQSLMRQLVWASLPLGKGIILDPFMGSGSTIAAAEHFGYESIGLEINEDYFKLAIEAIPRLSKLD